MCSIPSLAARKYSFSLGIRLLFLSTRYKGLKSFSSTRFFGCRHISAWALRAASIEFPVDCGLAQYGESFDHARLPIGLPKKIVVGQEARGRVRAHN